MKCAHRAMIAWRWYREDWRTVWDRRDWRVPAMDVVWIVTGR